MYGGDRGELELGACEVSVPKDHQVGVLESPTVLRLEFREDPERHVVLLGVHPGAAVEFYADLRACIERTARKEAFVFIHGYNVGFETAVRRTAQIAYDLKFEGAPIVYSWPSQEGLLSYTVDETNVAWTVPHLKDFLLGVAQQSGAKSVHLIAHSMGNRALTSALRELAMERKADCPRFHEVVLTAPDIDADVFRRDLAPAIVGTADRVTLVRLLQRRGVDRFPQPFTAIAAPANRATRWWSFRAWIRSTSRRSIPASSAIPTTAATARCWPPAKKSCVVGTQRLLTGP